MAKKRDDNRGGFSDLADHYMNAPCPWCKAEIMKGERHKPDCPQTKYNEKKAKENPPSRKDDPFVLTGEPVPKEGDQTLRVLVNLSVIINVNNGKWKDDAALRPEVIGGILDEQVQTILDQDALNDFVDSVKVIEVGKD